MILLYNYFFSYDIYIKHLQAFFSKPAFPRSPISSIHIFLAYLLQGCLRILIKNTPLGLLLFYRLSLWLKRHQETRRVKKSTRLGQHAVLVGFVLKNNLISKPVGRETSRFCPPRLDNAGLTCYRLAMLSSTKGGRYWPKTIKRGYKK